ncbi:MAG TPA: BatA domain-containing protein [Polyangia bacterium]
MSFLHPLFLLAGAAVVVPLLLHLSRRRNRAAIPWSSLRFLQPDPPRLERRKRVEQWLLLLLRCLAVVLLAVTFARPLLRQPLPGVPAARGARVVLLIDTSASMQRPQLWEKARARAVEILRGLGAEDRAAIVSFSDRATTVLAFETWANGAPGGRAALAATRLSQLAPGWGATDLGAALIAAAEVIGDDARTGIAVAEHRVVLLSDLTAGARLGALSAAEWPVDLRLAVERISEGARDNLSVHAVGTPDGAGAPGDRLQVRVTAHAAEGGTRGEPLRAILRWSDGAGAPTEVLVPRGEARLLSAPPRPATPAALLLEGDELDFDNRLFAVPTVPAPARIVYLGADAANDVTGSRYFLERAFVATRTRAPRVEALRATPDVALKGADLVVVTEAPAPASEALSAYLEAGGTVLFAPRDLAAAEGLGALAGGSPVPVREAPAGREAVMTRVQLEHPLLAAFADGRAGDFSHVRFWRHRVIDEAALSSAQVLARFDDGSPAWLLLPRGRGRIFVMTSGWNTGDSQLGLSSKLVPLFWSLLGAEPALGGAVVVGAPVALAEFARAETGALQVLRPDGRTDTLAAEARNYIATDLPGIYQLTRGATQAWFAVNLAPGESVVAPLPEEQLARVGLPTGGNPAATRTDSLRAEASARAREVAFLRGLEAQQKPWRFVLLVVLLALLAEALLTARRARPAQRTAGDAP